MIDLASLRAKQQQVMGRIVTGAALDIQHELGAVAAVVAQKVGGVCDIPQKAKGSERAQQKVNQKYDGDWLGIKDMSRCTIIVDDTARCREAVDAVRRHFVASNGWGYVETKPPKGSEDPCGYSDWKVIVERRGYLAEIQINTKAMIYAKSISSFRKTCANEEAKMKAKFIVPGGLGHQMFVVYRDNAWNERGAVAAAASNLYYDYFRSEPPLAEKGWAARKAVFGLNLNPAHV
jgi:hypothetical protein